MHPVLLEKLAEATKVEREREAGRARRRRAARMLRLPLRRRAAVRVMARDGQDGAAA